MQNERDGRRGFSRAEYLINSFPAFGSRTGMFPGLFGGRDPFDDPFVSRPLGGMFGPSAASSDTPQIGGGSGIIVEELNSDDEGEEDEVTGDGGENRKQRIVSSTEPSVEHPDDVVDAEKKGKNVTDRGDFNKVQGTQPQARSVSVHTSRVTYGGVDGAYYTSTRTRRAGGAGVMIEETKEADKTTGQAMHKVSRGIHDKGHSVTRKLNSDGKVDMSQTLHNLNEDELAGFEEAWNGNVKVHLPGWRDEFDNRGNAGERKGNASWRAGFLPSSEQAQSSGGIRPDNATRTTDGRTKKVVRINIE